MEFIYNKEKLNDEDFKKHREYEKYVYDSISEEITDIYRKDKDYDYEYETFLEEHFEMVKDDNEKIFEKYNSPLIKEDYSKFVFNGQTRAYPYYCFIKLCILKKTFLGIEKETCVFINIYDYRHPTIDYQIIIFYLKDNNKNIELAKKIWLDNLNCGNYSREKYDTIYFNNIEKYEKSKSIDYHSEIISESINDKEQYIFKELELKSKIEIEILVQEKITITEK